ncbi:MAG: hypothetical protein IT303_20060 [Dehalococcoidia bacterium]|nr:hypothetical protein [Dehalococcoidia bacterium]
MDTPSFAPRPGDLLVSRTDRFIGHVISIEPQSLTVQGRGRVILVPQDRIRVQVGSTWVLDCEPESIELAVGGTSMPAAAIPCGDRAREMPQLTV